MKSYTARFGAATAHCQRRAERLMIGWLFRFELPGLAVCDAALPSFVGDGI